MTLIQMADLERRSKTKHRKSTCAGCRRRKVSGIADDLRIHCPILLVPCTSHAEYAMLIKLVSSPNVMERLLLAQRKSHCQHKQGTERH